MRAHLCQLNLVWENARESYELVRRTLDRVEVARGDLVVLPEMFDSGFSLNVSRTADESGATLEFIGSLASERGVTLHASRTLRDPASGRGRNMATIAGPDGSIICEYAKIHPFSFGREGEAFDGGETITAYDWVGGAGERVRVCPAICYDLRFPELFRAGALEHGAEAFVIGANWPEPRQAHWRALAIARAIENQAFVLGVNRCGSDPHLRYAGGSIAVDPQGEILGELGSEQDVLSVEIEPARVREWRELFPALGDARLHRSSDRAI